jgi:3-keto-disaccharide hydrolase
MLRFLLLALAALTASAQTPSQWKIHDMERPRPREVQATPALMVPPPSDAIVLFDGDNLDQWAAAGGGEPRWIVRDGYMECVRGSGGIETKRSFGDVQLHVEFALPTPPSGIGQGRGNSGVKLMGLYEVQVLDSYKDYTYADGQAGAVYGQSPPLVNASLPPGEWQSFDIVFRRPRFRPDHSLVTPARLTVFHNGVLVQDNFEAWGPTRWLQYFDYAGHPDRLPLQLQDHANPVRFRNVWLRELDEATRPGPPSKPAEDVIQLSSAQAKRYAGHYDGIDGNTIPFEIVADGPRLYLFSSGRNLDLVAHSPTELAMRWADAKLVFTLDGEGNPERMVFHVGRHEFPTEKKR